VGCDGLAACDSAIPRSRALVLSCSRTYRHVARAVLSPRVYLTRAWCRRHGDAGFLARQAVAPLSRAAWVGMSVADDRAVRYSATHGEQFKSADAHRQRRNGQTDAHLPARARRHRTRACILHTPRRTATKLRHSHLPRNTACRETTRTSAAAPACTRRCTATHTHGRSDTRVHTWKRAALACRSAVALASASALAACAVAAADRAAAYSRRACRPRHALCTIVAASALAASDDDPSRADTATNAPDASADTTPRCSRTDAKGLDE
jgi:hypothetical protein